MRIKVGLLKITGASYLLDILFLTNAWNIITDYDNISPARPDINKFCPIMKGCSKGVHVLCLHNQNIYGKHGPSCNYSAEVTLLDVHKYRIVNYINSIRRKAALGKEKKLRRGYGIRMVSWDKYLADFAQIWADQCVFRTDFACHATPDFPNPAQIITGIRYSFPDMKKYERRFMNNITRGSNRKDKENAQSRAKKFVDRTILMVIEGWYKSKNNSAIKNMYYDQLVYHRVTHVGCGISVFISFEHQKKKKIAPVLNYMMLVCNLSHKLPRGKQPFDVEKNTSEGYTDRCGCPPGTMEDEDTCLCYTPQDENRVTQDCPYGVCKPKVVLLPIVTVENAAPALIGQRLQTSSDGENYFRIISAPSDVSLLDKEGLLFHQEQDKFQDFTRKLVDEPKVIVISRDNIKNFFKDELIDSKQPDSKPQDGHLPGKDENESNIFNPLHANVLNSGPHEATTIVKDVVHRKNFAVSQNVLDAYLAYKKNSRLDSVKFESDDRIKEFHQFTAHQTQDHQIGTDPDTKRKLSATMTGEIFRKENQNTNSNQQNSRIMDPKEMRDLLTTLAEENKKLQEKINQYNPLDNQPPKIQGIPDLKRNNKAESFTENRVEYFTKYPVIGSDPQKKIKDTSLHVKLNVNYDEIENNHSITKNRFHLYNANRTEPSRISDLNLTRQHDHDLLKLLDHLESEVHHLQLSKEEKDLLHKKLKKIYNDVGEQSRSRSNIKQVDRTIEEIRQEKYNNEPLHLYNTRPTIDTKEPRPHVQFTKAYNGKDVLSINRRRYYQDKLEKLAQKLLKRRKQHIHDNGRYVRPTLQDNYAQPYPAYGSVIPMRHYGDALYVPGRARAMHGYIY